MPSDYSLRKVNEKRKMTRGEILGCGREWKKAFVPPDWTTTNGCVMKTPPIETFGSQNISTSIYNYLFIKKYILLQIFSIFFILSRSFIGSQKKGKKITSSLVRFQFLFVIVTVSIWMVTFCSIYCFDSFDSWGCVCFQLISRDVSVVGDGLKVVT